MKVALAVQGGGMRAAYSMGALAAIQASPLMEQVEVVVASSGGALCSAYLLAGRAEDGVEDFTTVLCCRRFLSMRRFWRMVDVEYLVEEWMRQHRLADLPVALESGPRLILAATSWPTGRVDYFEVGGQVDPFSVLHASAAIPVYYGRRVRVGEGRYVDGGIGDPIPLFKASLQGVDLVVVVATRPRGDTRPGESGAGALIVRAWPRMGRGVRSMVLNGNPLAGLTCDAIARDGTGTIPTVVVAPSKSDALISRVCNDPEQVDRCVQLGRQDMLNALPQILAAAGG